MVKKSHSKKQHKKQNIKRLLKQKSPKVKQVRTGGVPLMPLRDNRTSFNQSEPTDLYIFLLNQGIALKRRGKYESSKEKYIEAIKLDPHRPLAYYNLGKVLYIQKHYDQAVRAYKTALQFGYDAMEAMRHLGHALRNREDDSAQAIHYRATIDPDFRDDLQYWGDMEAVHKLTEKEIKQHEEECMKAAVAFMDDSVVGREE